MKRIVVNALSVLALSASVGLLGCDSGGIETGTPTDTAKQDPSIDSMKKSGLTTIVPPSTAKASPAGASKTSEPTPAEKK
jgi:hypothetical protein